ncbi:putative ubiquitinyl hydrolase 1 [Lupinus albus]|uniref:Putative ubiquitinyl hydrolase 1 n=1 Tax=Lupinus albus TaxID=3870 RepID=A0A6A4NGJ0_LUPAL|nr:putative ubiquitinyl hydrolase 1 [Lupinus albus]
MDFQHGISRFISDAPPVHYTLKVQLFSLLTKNSIEKYESGEFEAGGYNWKLVVYPSGNMCKNVKDHISLHLALVGASSLHPDMEIHVKFRLFLLDQNHDNYLVLQDALGKERRFHKMKSECGFDEFIPLKEFNDESKGYLVEDMCVFGAEVFVCKEINKGKGESLVMVKDAIGYKHLWGIDNVLSILDSECHVSKPFNAAKYQWVIKLYPKGKGIGLGSGYMSLFLALADPTTLPPDSKIYTQILLRIVDQKQSNHIVGKFNWWFSASNNENGYPRYMLPSTLTGQFVGYVLKDKCLVEAEITVLGVVDALS